MDSLELRKLVPTDLELDLFEDKAWISVVAFSMEKVRPKNLPAFPPLSNFDEINIRTYVKYNGKPGVYFLSIEGGNKLSCKIAKGISGLPYRFSEMTRLKRLFKSKNLEFDDSIEIQYKVGSPIAEKSNIDIWLTERYALFQEEEHVINEFEIHHEEWALNSLTIDKLTHNYSRFNNFMDGMPIKVHYSKGVQVVAWNKSKIKP